MKRLLVLTAFLLGGCSPANIKLDETTLRSLSAAGAGSAICVIVSPVPPWFGGLTLVSEPIGGTLSVNCGQATIGAAVAGGMFGALPAGSVVTITMPKPLK